MANRLAASTSPYLLQHAENPVDWYPWGEEAFLRAQLENKPIFLSVGYSSCHWCHVMAHESFEDEGVAQLLNDSFVCVKVDREERPDVDEAYMAAVQLTSGRGGWPMSAFLTPDKRPFFAGTYFPPEDRGQVPGFKTLVRQLSMAWRTRRTEVEGAAREIERALRETLGARLPGTFTEVDSNFLNTAVHTLLGDFDPLNGGFGGAPKFPPHSAIELLIAFSMRQSAPEELRSAALTAALFTLERMCQGGIRDHVGGGFHRYSTDAEWKLPHFEKMLYDNGLILSNLVQGAFLATQLPGANAEFLFEAASEAATWLVREMRAEDGTFYSAIDADSEGEEGRYYTWTPESVMELLGPDAGAFLDTYQFTPEGNYNDEATGEPTERSIPFLVESLPKGTFLDAKRILLRAREHRERPLVDHKAIVGWNGIVIGALADAGQIELATAASVAILGYAEVHGRLPHMVTQGVPMGEAFLDDYAHFCDGMIRLALALQATNRGGEEFARAAGALADEMVALFRDEASGAFYSTSARHEELFGRTIPVFDQPIPSGNAVAIRVLAQLGRTEEAIRALRSLAGWMERAPGATESLLLSALYLVPDEEVEETEETPVAAIPIAEAKLVARLSEREAKADASGTAQVSIQVTVPEGMHVNSDRPPARWLTPTEVKVNGVKATIGYPPATDDRYEGSFEIGLTLALPAGAKDAEYEVTLGYQLCTETECLPSTEIRLSGVLFR